MKDIRESAGVSTGSLYMYFSNKEEIFISVLENTIREQDIKNPPNNNISCFERIENYIENVKEYCNNIQEGIAPVAYEYSISAWRDEERKRFMNERYNLGVGYIKGLIEDGINSKEFSKDIDVDRISNFMITVFNMNKWVRENLNKFSGSILVLKGEETIIDNGFGFADEVNKINNDSNTRFLIGSISKMFTAVAIMKLYEEKSLDINDSASKYLNIEGLEDDIKIVNLLNHTSGLKNYVMYNKTFDLYTENKPLRIAETICNMKRSFKVGKKFSYNNTGYLILALIIESITNIKFEEYVEKNIFIPLAMNDSEFLSNANKERASGYKNGKVEKIFHHSAFFGCGDIIATTGDLKKFMLALNTGKIIRKDLAEGMKGISATNKLMKYGYGCMITDRVKERGIGHGGSVPYISVINNKGNYLKNMLDDFFDYAKMSSKDIELRKAEVNLNELVMQLLDCEEINFKEKKINLQMELEKKTVHTFADPNLIARAFNNLISNAVKYSKECETIKVILEEKNINDITYGVFSISNIPKNNISKKEISNLFERLYKVDKSRKEDGSGLGLAITQQIVKAHNGFIGVELISNKIVFSIGLIINFKVD